MVHGFTLTSGLNFPSLIYCLALMLTNGCMDVGCGKYFKLLFALLFSCEVDMFSWLVTALYDQRFRVYQAGSAGPLLLLLHGGGHSALTWSVFTVSYKSLYCVGLLDEPNPTLWLATSCPLRIACCVSRKIAFFYHVINYLLTKLGWSKWGHWPHSFFFLRLWPTAPSWCINT